MKVLKLLIIFLMSSAAADAEHQKYHLSKREVFVYVDVGWRLCYEVNGFVTASGLDVSQGLRLDVLAGSDHEGDKWAGFDSPSMSEFSDMLGRCVTSVSQEKVFKERIGRVELDYDPKKFEVCVKTYGGMTIDSKNKVFISAKVPISKMKDFRNSVNQATDDFGIIHRKLSKGNEDGPIILKEGESVILVPENNKALKVAAALVDGEFSVAEIDPMGKSFGVTWKNEESWITSFIKAVGEDQITIIDQDGDGTPDLKAVRKDGAMKRFRHVETKWVEIEK